jgi:hypothetical protein
MNAIAHMAATLARVAPGAPESASTPPKLRPLTRRLREYLAGRGPVDELVILDAFGAEDRKRVLEALRAIGARRCAMWEAGE